MKDKSAILQSQDTDSFKKEFRQHLVEICPKMSKISKICPTDTTTWKRDPFKVTLHGEPAWGRDCKTIFQNREKAMKHDTKELLSFRTGNYKFLRGNRLLKRSYPELILWKKLQKAHPLVKNLFWKVDAPKVSLAECSKHFVRIWEKLTRDKYK